MREFKVFGLGEIINLDKSDKKEINDDNNIIKENNNESKKIEDKIKNEIDNPQINS